MSASDDQDGETASGTPKPPPAAAPLRRSRQMWIPAILAAGIVLGLWGPNLVRPPPQAWTAYISVKGQTRRVKLADHSLLRLNGATALRVMFEDPARHATFEGGEAEFDIAPNGRPFLLSVGDREARTDTADFNLRRYGRLNAVLAVLTVRRGMVEVGSASGTDRMLALKPGDQLSWIDGQAALPVRRVDPATAFAWQDHKLVYDHAPLKDVVADLNRYVDRPIGISQAAVGELPFTGVLMLDTEDRMLKRLQAALPIQAQAQAAAIVLKTRQPGAAKAGKPGRAKPAKPPGPGAPNAPPR